MIIKMSSGNRITLPSKLVKDYNIEQGDCFDIIFEEGRLILNPVNKVLKNSITLEIEELEEENIEENTKENIEENTKENIEKEPKLKLPILKVTNPNNFISNLEEGQSFSKKYYSECGLLIRTKNSYIKKYCENCQGQLLDNYEGFYNCIYKRQQEKEKLQNNKNDEIEEVKETIQNDEVKETIQNIHQNVFKVKKEIEKRASIIESIQKTKEEHKKLIKNTYTDSDFLKNIDYRDDNTTVKFVRYNHYHECSVCGNYVQTGVLLNRVQFLCNSCAKEDFINYINKSKEENYNV